MTPRVRVLEFATMFEIGGTERQLVELIDRLDLDRFDLQLACLRRAGQLLGHVEERGLLLTEFPIHRLYGPAAFRQQARLASYLHTHAVDVVHTQGFYANVFALPAAFLAGTPVRVGSVREQPGMWRPAQERVNRLALSLASCVIVNAETVRRELIARGVPPGKLRLVRNGVDVDRFARAAAPPSLRASLGWPEDAIIVGTVSRLAAGKGIEELLDAAAEIARVRPRARFLVVGDGGRIQDGTVVCGDYRRELERRAEGLGLAGRARFTGYRLDVPELWAATQVAVVPSRSEALSNSLLEAMAAGAAVVTTGVGDHPLVVEDGATGRVVPPGDRDALARAILQLVDDRELAARMGASAQRHVREHFSLAGMVANTERIYQQALERVRAPAPRRATVNA